MQKKCIKLFFEMVVIFILPAMLIATCFSTVNTVDANGSILTSKLEFNDVFASSDSFPLASVFSDLYSALGITSNVLLQIIVIYVILLVIMFIVWHLIYVPLDFIAHLPERKDL